MKETYIQGEVPKDSIKQQFTIRPKWETKIY